MAVAIEAHRIISYDGGERGGAAVCNHGNLWAECERGDDIVDIPRPMRPMTAPRRVPSEADLAAVELVLGIAIVHPVVPEMRTWDIASSTGYYRVEERPDTKLGGTYLFCPCPGWKFQKGKGKDCRHVAEAHISPSNEWAR